MTLLFIIFASLASGVIALLAALALLKGRLWSVERSHAFLSFAAGTLLAVAFLDLMPEAIERLGEIRGGDVIETALLFILLGFLLFFAIEKFILWHHCHEERCEVRASASIVLIGDTLHNFLDGIAIAVAFLVSPAIGLATTVAIFAHEIPQEVADFSILLSSGMKKSRALRYNMFSSLASLVGAVAAYFFATAIDSAIPFLIALTAGGFTYIAAADLIPEIHKEERRTHMVFQFLLFFVGILFIFILTSLFAH
ncbi:TPA: ZIP zinc transporter [Candidatus Uhrbacteria bacterium]|nr:MAG: Zinc transporter ZIP [Parcubacteria group bacterium GW2011_GWA2_53_21]OGL72097.1 MAG: hypothetical protein A3D69_01555 [Candidatus Uhrbacteria bacterium RIFCSPHIGHO2_02_FULL_54_11]HBL39602.1 ZIP zinc transporter [Candidatus Uhrbacteria bacterium]